MVVAQISKLELLHSQEPDGHATLWVVRSKVSEGQARQGPGHKVKELSGQSFAELHGSQR